MLGSHRERQHRPYHGPVPRVCTACHHLEREAIDAALVADAGIRTTADRFGLSHQALLRHRDAHLPETLLRSHEAREEVRSLDLVHEARRLYDQAHGLCGEARAAGERATAIRANAESRACLELLARVQGTLVERHELSVVPERPNLDQVIAEVLARSPDFVAEWQRGQAQTPPVGAEEILAERRRAVFAGAFRQGDHRPALPAASGPGAERNGDGDGDGAASDGEAEPGLHYLGGGSWGPEPIPLR